MTTVQTNDKFSTELGRLCEKYGPAGRKGEFMMDVNSLIISAIQAGRAAAQGANGIVICGTCNKVVHQCPKKG